MGHDDRPSPQCPAVADRRSTSRSRALAATASRRSRRWKCRSPRRWAASPPRCRRWRRACPHATSPRPTAGPLRARDLVGASSYSPLPLADDAGLGRSRRCHAGGLRLRDRCRPGRARRVRWFRCWRKRFRGRGFAAPAAISPQASPLIAAGRRIAPHRSADRARGGTGRHLTVRRPRLRLVDVPAHAGVRPSRRN